MTTLQLLLAVAWWYPGAILGDIIGIGVWVFIHRHFLRCDCQWCAA